MKRFVIVALLCVASVAQAKKSKDRTKKKPPATKPSTSPATASAAPPPASAGAVDTPPPVAVDAPPAKADAAAGAHVETKGKKVKEMDFTAMGIEGKVLTPQLLYLLGRIKVELEKASLESRSFVPELVRSVDEGGM
jgi:hypothetical protein